MLRFSCQEDAAFGLVGIFDTALGEAHLSNKARALEKVNGVTASKEMRNPGQ